jgi:predicted nucleotidyltransferase
MKIGQLEVEENGLQEPCRRWHIAKLEAFGSVLRSDFNADSDVDLLVTFEAGANPVQFGLIEAEREFSALIGREVDLVPRDGLKWVIQEPVQQEARPVFSK